MSWLSGRFFRSRPGRSGGFFGDRAEREHTKFLRLTLQKCPARDYDHQISLASFGLTELFGFR